MLPQGKSEYMWWNRAEHKDSSTSSTLELAPPGTACTGLLTCRIMIQTSIGGSLAINPNGQNRKVLLCDYPLKHQTKTTLFMLVLVFTTMVQYRYCISDCLHQKSGPPYISDAFHSFLAGQYLIMHTKQVLASCDAAPAPVSTIYVSFTQSEQQISVFKQRHPTFKNKPLPTKTCLLEMK